MNRSNLALVALASCCVTLGACGGASSSSSSGGSTAASRTDSSSSRGSSSSAATNEAVRIVASGPPELTAAMVAADAPEPSLIVDTDGAWVVVPSLRLAVAMPTGWYWTDFEGLLDDLAQTDLELGPEQTEGLRRGLQAAANQYPPHHPATANALIPSVRVMLFPVGVPAGTSAPVGLCERSFLPEMRTIMPDVQLTSETGGTHLGRPTIRCTMNLTVPGGGREFPGHNDNFFVFGESRTLLISSVGGVEAPVTATLDGVIASMRSL